jgi:hypothetical protein
MPARIIVETPEGYKIGFGEDAPRAGLREVAITAPDVATAAGKQFEGALASLGYLIGALEKSLAKVAKRPDSVEMEFRASLSGDCDLWVVSGSGEAEFTVTLKWGKE